MIVVLLCCTDIVDMYTALCSEYRNRCDLYAREVWVCQCTGHTGLTHKEAWDSEHKIRNMLEASFPEFLHKPILSVVHHSKLQHKASYMSWLFGNIFLCFLMC